MNTRGLIYRIYWILTGWIHQRWLGGVQAAFVVRSLYLQKALARSLREKKMRVLDVGCGEQASISAVLARRFKNCHFVATDIVLFPPPNRLPNLDLVIQDIQQPCLRGTFDIIFALDVLEHLENPKKVLSTLARWLRPGGFLFLHTPCVNKVTFFAGASEADHPFQRAVRPGDLHKWDGFQTQEIEAWLQELKLSVVRTVHTFNPVLWFLKELYTLGERRRIPGIGILLIPFIVSLTRCEMAFPPSMGNGIWIEAMKPG